MKNIKLKLIFLYYGILLMLPTSKQDTKNQEKQLPVSITSQHKLKEQKNIMANIQQELSDRYKKMKINILSEYGGDYEYYCYNIKKEMKTMEEICKENLNGTNRKNITKKDLDFLYRWKIILSSPSDNDVHIIESICIILKSVIIIEENKCATIFNIYLTAASSNSSLQNNKSYIEKIWTKGKRNGHYLLSGKQLLEVSGVDHEVVHDALVSTSSDRIKFSSCTNGIFQVEGEYLRMHEVLSKLHKICVGQKLEFVRIYGFSEILYDVNLPIGLAKYIAIIAPTITRAGDADNFSFHSSKENCYILFINVPHVAKSGTKEFILTREDQKQQKITNNLYLEEYLLFKYSGNNPYETEVNKHYPNFLPTVTEYRSALIQSLKFMNYGKKISLIVMTNKSPKFQNYADTMLMYTDVISSINNNVKITVDNPRIVFYEIFYTSLLERIKIKLQKNDRQKSEERELLNYMNSAITSKLVLLKSRKNVEKTFVVGLDNYIKVVENRVALLESNNYIQTIRKINSEYKKSIDTKIHEGQLYTKNIIDLNINDIQTKLIESVKKLKPEIGKKQTALKKDVQFVLQQLPSVIINNLISYLFNFLEIFLEPLSIISENVLDSGNSMRDTINRRLDRDPTLLADLEQRIQQLNAFLIKHDENDNNIINRMLAIPELDDNAAKHALNSFKAMNMTGSKLGSAIKYLKTGIHKLEKSKDKGDFKKLGTFKKAIEYANVGVGAVPVGVNIFKDLTEIITWSQILKEKRKVIQALDELSSLITDRLIPFLHKINLKLEKEKEDLQHATSIKLNIKQWAISELLSSIRVELNTISFGFEAQPEIVALITKLNKYFEILIKIYDRIQSYAEHKNFADYITNIQNPNIKMSDSKFEQARLNLNSLIKKDVIIKIYYGFLDSVIQYAFPFKNLFFQNIINDYNSRNDRYINNTESLKKLVNYVTTNLHQIRINMKTIQSHYTPAYHPNIRRQHFNMTTIPFAEWHYSNYSTEIHNLLIGRKVLLIADQPKTLNINVIKFITANILIKSNDVKEDKALNNDLKNITVELTHLGDSRYKCDDRYIIIDSTEFEMACDYGTDVKQCQHCCTESAKMYMESGYPQLSPYATYSIQLTQNMNPNAAINLAKYAKPSVSIYLVGYGQFIRKTKRECDMENYDYELIF